MAKSSKHTTQSSGTLVSITSVGEAGGVPMDGTLLDAENLEGAVEAAVGQMDWLSVTDRAMVELALSYARQIDMANLTAVAAADQIRKLDGMDPEEAAPLLESANRSLAASQKAHYLGPHLHNALKSLGGDPASRQEIAGAGSESAATPSDPLAAMRAKRKGA